jgi:lipopolysaccharide export LptBFGC system permease protein LptF
MNTCQLTLFLVAFALWIGFWVYVTEKFIRPWCGVAIERLIDRMFGV